MLRRRVGKELLRPTGQSAVGVEGRGSFCLGGLGGAIEADGLPQGGREQHRRAFLNASSADDGASGSTARKRNLGSPAPPPRNPPAAMPTGFLAHQSGSSAGAGRWRPCQHGAAGQTCHLWGVAASRGPGASGGGFGGRYAGPWYLPTEWGALGRWVAGLCPLGPAYWPTYS